MDRNPHENKKLESLDNDDFAFPPIPPSYSPSNPSSSSSLPSFDVPSDSLSDNSREPPLKDPVTFTTQEKTDTPTATSKVSSSPSPPPPPPLLQNPLDPILENCVTKSILSAVMGGCFGFIFGGVFGFNNVTAEEAARPFVRQILDGVKLMMSNGWSMGKNFAVVGAVFSGTECAIEQYRGKNDMWNSLSAGCITGSAFAIRVGPKAMMLGCAGFAAFSYAIDYFTGRHDETFIAIHDDDNEKYD